MPKTLKCPMEGVGYQVLPGWLKCSAPQLSLLHPPRAVPPESWEVLISEKGFLDIGEVH